MMPLWSCDTIEIKEIRNRLCSVSMWDSLFMVKTSQRVHSVLVCLFQWLYWLMWRVFFYSGAFNVQNIAVISVFQATWQRAETQQQGKPKTKWWKKYLQLCNFFINFIFIHWKMLYPNEQHPNPVTSRVTLPVFVILEEAVVGVSQICQRGNSKLMPKVKYSKGLILLRLRCQTKAGELIDLTSWDDDLTPTVEALRISFLVSPATDCPPSSTVTCRSWPHALCSQSFLPLIAITPVILLHLSGSSVSGLLEPVGSLGGTKPQLSSLQRWDTLTHLCSLSDGAPLADILGCYGEIRDSVTPLWIQSLPDGQATEKKVFALLLKTTRVFY